MPNNLLVPDLVGGIAQLPMEARAPNQVTTADNAYPSRRFGLRKRPPAVQVAQLHADQTNQDKAFVHFVERTPDERYVIYIADGSLKVFDAATGAEQTVDFPDGSGYLDATTRGYRAFTVGDHTYIINRDKVVKRGSTRTAAPTNEALVYVRMVSDKMVFGFQIDRFHTHYQADSHDGTIEVAAQLYNKLVNDTDNSGFTDQFTITLLGSTIYIVKKDGQPFKIENIDGLADKGLKIVQGSVQAQEDLPERAVDGMVVAITGDPKKDASTTPPVTVYVRYDADGGSDHHGVWVECPEPGVVVDYDYSTMPHELIREGTYGKQLKSASLWWQPTIAAISGTPAGYGWSKDGSDVALTGSTSEIQVIEAYGDAVRSEAVTGDASLLNEVTFGFDVDTGTANAGAPIDVVFSANTGAGWVEIDRRHYNAGQKISNQTFSHTAVYPTGTKFELRMDYGAIAILPSSTFPLASRTSRVMAHGKNDNIPGITITPAAGYRFSLGKENADITWPMGAVVTVHLGSDVFTYTLPDDQDTPTICTNIAAVIDADAAYVSAYEGPSYYSSTGKGSKVSGLGSFVNNVWGKGIYLLPAPGWVVARADGTVPAASGVTASITLDNTVYMWSKDAAMTPSEHVGRKLENVSDGSSGTITANSATCIKIGALTGGVYNVFSMNDICQVANASLNYVFQQVPWTIRTCGNDDKASNPFPGFVDRKINDGFYHLGRLGFLAEDFVCLSGSADLLDFWRTTVSALIDSDRIDVRGASGGVDFFDSAIGWDGKLMLCSPSGRQFALIGEPYLSAATIRIEPLSAYPQTDTCRPIALGHSVFLPGIASGYTQLTELFVTRDGVQAEGSTDHIPRLISGNALQLAGDGTLGFLAVLPDGGSQDVLYVLNYSPVGSNDRQVAWSKWTFGGGGRIVGIAFSKGVLYVAHYRAGAVYLDSIDVANPPAASATHQDPGATNYTMTVQLSDPFLRDRNGNPVHSGRTQIHTVSPILDRSGGGFVKVTVAPTNRDAKSYVVDGLRKKRAPVLAASGKVTVSIVNDGSQASATGTSITGLEYEVSLDSRSR